MNAIQPEERAHIAKKTTWVGFVCNLMLTIGKILAGLLGRSSAMIADGIHSLSDFVTDIVVICFISISAKGKDEDHNYGHGKYETFATFIISVMLIVVGAGLLWASVTKVLVALQGESLTRPEPVALMAAIASIIVKEGLYQYTARAGRRIASDTVVANAWHHRSDALSSVGTLVGIGGAMFLGESFRVLDPIACGVVSVFIIVTGAKLLLPAVRELLETSLPVETEREIGAIVTRTPGVRAYHNMKTRKSGSAYIVDLHIKVDPYITVNEGHAISHAVEENLRARFGITLQTSIHIEPWKGPSTVSSQPCD